MRWLGISVALWLVACTGGGKEDDVDGTEADADTDADADADADADVDSDTDTDTDTTSWVETTFAAPLEEPHDIVLVVDNSCSMSDDQADLGGAMVGVIDILDAAGLDWRIGVTTTDVDANGYGDVANEGRLEEIGSQVGVYAGDADAELTLQAMIAQGSGGSGEEKGLAAAYMAVEVRGGTDNASFFRDEAGLHFVILSDEEDQSDQLNPELVTLPEFENWLDELAALKPQVSFSAIVCTAPVGIDCPQSYVGTRYMTVAENWGLIHDIHDPITTSILAIATAIANNSGLRHLPLDELPPDPSALEVWIDGVMLDPAEWSYDAVANAVELVDAAPRGAEVVVRYPE